MRASFALKSALFLAITSHSVEGDLFNYGLDTKTENSDQSFGQPNWASVTCSDVNTCTGYPEKYPYASFNFAATNNCLWCPASGPTDACSQQHRQSPIDLKRDVAVVGSPNENDCPDWHWMRYEHDSCSWDDMKDQFTIARNALQIHTPQDSNGDISCNKGGKHVYPRMDYSRGFPKWWYLQRTDITVPSQHTQDGNQYAAEVTLSHFYSIDDKNKMGNVGVFLQNYPDAESWPYLDKLICQWRIEEEKVRAKCNQDPAPTYGRCQLFRNQQPTQVWLDEQAGKIFRSIETRAPSAARSAPAHAPVDAFTDDSIHSHTASTQAAPTPIASVPTTPPPQAAVPTTPSPTAALPSTPSPTAALPTTPIATLPTTPSPTASVSATPAPATRRNLRSEESGAVESVSLLDKETIPDGAKIFDVFGKKFLLRKENFEESEEDDQVYFDRIYAEHKQRSLQLSGIHSENYANIDWYPYEWNIRVQTEYYFRSEGTMLVPPCFEIVAWRQYKDPIKVHRRQIDELNRLLAWRLNPDTCTTDTAGIVSSDGKRINVNREVQFTTNSHEQVFCECKNWPSKFAADKEWCHHYQNDTNYDRFFKHPYNFDSGGKFLPF